MALYLSPSGRCIDCGEPHGLHHAAWRCTACFDALTAVRREVRRVMRQAMRQGVLRPLIGLDCVDCGGKAVDYDHRDYTRPLDVQPVCRKCNQRRGPAVWRKAA